MILQTDTALVTGRIVDSTGVPLADVHVGLTPPGQSAGDVPAQAALTNRTGTFRFWWPVDRPFVLSANRVGYIAGSLYVARGPAKGAVWQRDFALHTIATAVVQLAPVVTRARRAPAEIRRNTPGENRTADFAFTLDRLPVTPGDLGQAATRAPGVVATGVNEDGSPSVSIGGQSPTQNQTAVDGATFSSTTLPPEAIASSGVVLSAYDAAFGQFTGGQLVATTRSGTNMWSGVVRGTLGPPQLRIGYDPRADRSIRTMSEQLSAGAGGALRQDRWFVYGSATVSQRSGPLASLDPSDAAGLAQLRVPEAAAQTFDAAARRFGLGSLGPTSSASTASQGSGIVRSDVAIGEKHLLTVRLDGRTASTVGAGGSPYTLALGRNTLRNYDGGGLLAFSSRWETFQHDLRAYASSGARQVDLGSSGPAARVLVTEDGDPAGIATLRAGGNPFGFRNATRRFAEISDELRGVLGRGTHQWKVGAVANRERTTSRGRFNEDGTFTFASVNDFATGTPAAFTRTLDADPNATTAAATEYAAAYLGDTWALRPRTALTAGLRAERSRYVALGSSALDTAITASARGALVRPMPESAVLPRLGLTTRSAGGRVEVRGGVGAFRGRVRSAGLTSVFADRRATRTLSCIGAATPTPAWADYAVTTARIPVACDGAGPFDVAATPSASVFAPTFGAPRTTRASVDADVQIRTGLWLRTRTSLTQGRREGLAVDRNLRLDPAFTLPAEGGRPVFATPDAVDARTGLISPSASRQNATLGSVRELRGDGRSHTLQLSVGAEAITPWGGSVALWYTRTDARDLSSGASAFGVAATPTTAGDPRTVEWGPREFLSRNLVQSTLTQRVWQLDLSAIARVSSGVPFTPRVDSDINGDGDANDRAFIPDPRTAPDTGVARGLRQLLAAAPSQTRHCLATQIGRIAGRGSCLTSWSPALDLQANSRPWIVRGQSVTAILTVQNLTAGLDYVLHGPADLRGWGQLPFPDDVLLRVRGFDPQQRRFAYAVNPAFGRYGDARGGRTPMVISLQLRIALHADPARQQYANLLAVARAARQSPSAIRARLVDRFPDVALRSLAFARHGQLALTNDQAAQLREITDALRPTLAAGLDSLSRAIAETPNAPDASARRLAQQVQRTVDAGRERVRAVLTAGQWNLLPPDLRSSTAPPTLDPPVRIELPNP